jgi:hypothetical protein
MRHKIIRVLKEKKRKKNTEEDSRMELNLMEVCCKLSQHGALALVENLEHQTYEKSIELGRRTTKR